jgi:hypothetical protein
LLILQNDSQIIYKLMAGEAGFLFKPVSDKIF